jgi:hypothetical protein
MEGKQSKARVAMPTRWDAADWAYLGEVAQSIGKTRSDFIRTAALNAAKAIRSLAPLYSVEGPQATSQNTRINFSGSEGDIKAAPGGRRAPVRSRSDCGAKDGPNEEIDDPKDENPTGGKV